MDRGLLICVLFTVCLFSCGGQKMDDSRQEGETERDTLKPEIEAAAVENSGLSAVPMDSSYVPVSTFGVEFNADPRPGVSDDAMEMPKMKGLYTSDRWAFCQKDSCMSGHYLVGIRCPQNAAVRQWVNNQLWERTKEDGYDKKAPDEMVNHLEIPFRKVVDFYLNQWQQGFDHNLNKLRECEKSGKFSLPTEHVGMIITDVWQNEGYYTMCLHSWFDMMSAGSPYSTSFYTIDASSGKVLSLNDIIAASDTLKIERLLMGKLAWMKKQNGASLQDMNYLENRSGVALINEGLLVYFHPYSIGAGFEGQYNVVIPFNQVEEEGVTLKIL